MRGQFPRVSTRGYYDLDTGKTLKTSPYHLYPRSFFDSLVGAGELALMMHGLRNDRAGALEKFVTAQRRLRQVGYRHPVVGYSYDSNTRGAHLARSALKALHVGQKIARKNGRNLSRFILDFKRQSPETKIRLMGHSLGSQVILHAVERLAHSPKNDSVVESVHFFGGSVGVGELSSARYSAMLQRVVNGRVVNYFSPQDEGLMHAHDSGAVLSPIGYLGCRPRPFPKYTQKRVRPKNHRFASYAATIRSFP